MTQKKTVAELKAEIVELKKQCALAISKTKTVFRIESTQNSDNLHISFNNLFDAEQVKTEYESDFIETKTERKENKNTGKVSERDCYVFNVVVREKLTQKIIKALKLLDEQ